MKRLFAIVIVLTTIIFINNADAGRLYARNPGTETPIYNLRISHIRTSISIFNQLAVTHVDEEFYNDNDRTLEGFYAFQLPEGSKVDGLWLWVDGKRLIFVVKKKEEAQRLYDSVVIGTRRDPAILEMLGSNRFQLKVWPINPKSSRRIELQYFYTLPLGDDGRVHYTYPLNNLDYQSVPVDRTEMTIDVRGKQNITQFTTSFDDRPLMNRVTKVDDQHYSVSFGTENQNYVEDYKLSFMLEDLKEIFPVLTWANPNNTSEDPYFMMWFPMQKSAAATGPRDYVFVLDASGSMDGARIQGVKLAYEKILQSLRENDRFRIVIFASNAISNPADTALLFATQQNVSTAIDYINKNYIANGGTNYQDAFRVGLSANLRTEAEKRMIFLTDGEPTVGATDYQTILNTIKLYDKANVRIFPVLLYTSQIKLLYDIAAERWGKVTNIEQGTDLHVAVSRLLFDLDLSGFQNVNVTYKNNLPYDTYPRTFSTVVSSDQLIVTGRFTQDGIEQVTLGYTDSKGNPATNIVNVALLRSHSSLIQVSRYWASKKIDALLDDIRNYGEKPELKNSVIALSMQYMILTPYTAFLVLETNPIDPTSTIAEGTVAKDFNLLQNYPNPFSVTSIGNPSTNITFEVPRSGNVKLVVYDILGRVVRTLVDKIFNPGRHTILWDGRDENGQLMQTGIYFCVMKAGNYQKTIRMTLLK